MNATLTHREAQTFDPMGRPKKPRTKTVRVHEDVADLAEMLAPIYKKSVPDFVSEQLRQVFKKLSDAAPKQLQEQITRGLREPQ